MGLAYWSLQVVMQTLHVFELKGRRRTIKPVVFAHQTCPYDAPSALQILHARALTGVIEPFPVAQLRAKKLHASAGSQKARTERGPGSSIELVETPTSGVWLDDACQMNAHTLAWL